MYQLNFTLQQHTPVIHFQHDQEGATLRATEVKPKLDRFILNSLRNNDYKEGIKIAKEKKWLIGEHAALNYKMRIESVNQEIIYLKDKYHDGIVNPIYFGNMGDTSPKHYSISEKINITIVSFCKGIIESLNENLICSFFLLHNFGSRQTKGFGSFTVIKFNDALIGLPIIPKGTHSIVLEKDLNIEKVFAVIDYYWKRLKSGINYSKETKRDSNTHYCHDNRYQKSFLFQYTNSLKSGVKYTWEKRWMKERFFGLSSKTNNVTPHFTRALLGLQDKFEFISKDTCNPDKEESSEMNSKFQKKNIKPVHIEEKENQIERIKSPILFKPIKIGNKYHVYIFIQDDHIRSAIYGSSISKIFSFECSKQERLMLPEENLNFYELLDKYHQHLGTSFEAKDFKWRIISIVQTQKQS